MKRVKFLLVVCLLGMASTVSAQFVNTNRGSNSSMNSSSDATAWSGLRISYHPVSVNTDGGGSVSLNGASVGYVQSFGVSANAPLFIETGANASWIGGESYDDVKINLFSINVPINFGYKFSFGDNNGIFPYAGLTMRGNIVGKYKMFGESISVFDDELGDGWKFKRFQIGWQIGVGANFNTFFVGASYGTDFNEISDGGKVAMPSLTIGFNI